MMMFRQPSFLDYYRELSEKARGEVWREKEETIVGTDTDELANYIYEQYALPPIEIDEGRDTSWELEDYVQDIPEQARDSIYHGEGAYRDFPCQRAIVEVPIVPNPHIQTIAQLRASTHSLSYSDRDFGWSEDEVTFSFETKGYGFQHDTEKIRKEIEAAHKRIQETIHWKNDTIEQQNRELLQNIKNAITERKKKLSEDKEKVAELTKSVNIPLKKKKNEGAHSVQLKRNNLVQRVKPEPNLPEEYVLDENKVEDVINVLDNQAKTYEQTPIAVQKLGEEDIRDFLLANLNSVFEGGATGETFSKKGKTDIYLQIAKGNIFIAECKIWGGQKLYGETIDQLRGYLTWRHNFGALLTFVRNKYFSKVLKEAQSAITSHPSYIRGFREVNETHYVSNHVVDDEDKEVKIHHLFYHLYSGAE